MPTSLKGWEKGTPALNLKGEPENNAELSAQFEAINPGYHMSKIHWITVDFNSDVSDKMMCELINNSYDLVYKSLTKKQIAQLEAHVEIIHSSLDTIEACGGGSARCMMAEIFLPKN